MLVIEDHGADALRLYLINSQVMRGESFRFRKDGVEGIVRDVLIPWYNTFNFLLQNIDRYEAKFEKFIPETTKALASDNIFDKWIISSLNSLVEVVQTEMENYRVYSVVPKMLEFIQDLSNWYVRLNRDRLKGLLGEADSVAALQTLFHVLYQFNLCMAPFACFMTEHIYHRLNKYITTEIHELSVHFLSFPKPQEQAQHLEVERMVSRMQDVVVKIRTMRDRNKLPVKQPLSEVVVIHSDPTYISDIETTAPYIKSETSLVSVIATSNEADYVILSANANFKALGPKLGKKMKEAGKIVSQMTHDDINRCRDQGMIELGGFTFTPNDLILVRSFKQSSSQFYEAMPGDEGSLVLLNLSVTPELLELRKVREVVAVVQKMRKTLGLVPGDLIEVFVETSDCELLDILKTNSNTRDSLVVSKLGCTFSSFSEIPHYFKHLGEQTVLLDETSIRVVVCAAALVVSTDLLEKIPKLGAVVPLLNYGSATDVLGTGKLCIRVDDIDVELDLGENVFKSMFDFLYGN
ncbi:hypothetical protein GEMRC1_000573 [Eukaryota sp. GEM-RC1]